MLKFLSGGLILLQLFIVQAWAGRDFDCYGGMDDFFESDFDIHFSGHRAKSREVVWRAVKEYNEEHQVNWIDAELAQRMEEILAQRSLEWALYAEQGNTFFKLGQKVTMNRQKFTVTALLGIGDEGEVYLVRDQLGHSKVIKKLGVYQIPEFRVRSRYLNNQLSMTALLMDEEAQDFVENFWAFFKGAPENPLELVADTFSASEIKRVNTFLREFAEDRRQEHLMNYSDLRSVEMPSLEVLGGEAKRSLLLLNYVRGVSVADLIERQEGINLLSSTQVEAIKERFGEFMNLALQASNGNTFINANNVVLEFNSGRFIIIDSM